MRYIFIGATILLLWGSAAKAQVVDAPQVGGMGGGPFDDACKPGDVMIGYNVSDGKAMDLFAAVCQAQNKGVFVGNNYGLHTWGKEDSSIPHLFYKPRCPGGSAISELQVFVNRFNELDSVSATCSPLRPNGGASSPLQRTVPMGGKVASSGVSTCPRGMIAVGVTGRSGALVDRVGLKCAPLAAH